MSNEELILYDALLEKANKAWNSKARYPASFKDAFVFGYIAASKTEEHAQKGEELQKEAQEYADGITRGDLEEGSDMLSVFRDGVEFGYKAGAASVITR